MENLLKILYIGRSSEGISELRTHSDISVIQKSNSLEAVNYLKSGNLPDAIISEVYLSGFDGLEMYKWLRDRPEYDHLAFILISYEFKEDLIRTAFSQRIDDFYVLPLPPAEKLIGRLSFLVDFRNKHPQTSEQVAEIKDLK